MDRQRLLQPRRNCRSLKRLLALGTVLLAAHLAVSAVVLGAGEPVAEDAKPAQAASTRAAAVAAIHLSARQGTLERLKALLDQHPELIDARQDFPSPRKPLRTDSFTPLQCALWFQQSDVAALLIERGAEVNVADGADWTPLHIAAWRGDLASVKRLVKRGAKLGAKTPAAPEFYGVPPSSPEGAKPVYYPAIPAQTPLDLAVKHDHAEVAQYLKSLPVADQSSSSEEPQKKAPDAAKDAPVKLAEAWFQALVGGKPDEALAYCDVPFSWDRKQSVKTLAELKSRFQGVRDDNGPRDLKLSSASLVEPREAAKRLKTIWAGDPPEGLLVARLTIGGEQVEVIVRPGKEPKVVGFSD